MVNLGIFSAAMIAFDPFLHRHGALGPARRGWCRASGGAHRLLRRRLRRLLLHRARAGAAGRVPAPALVSNQRRRRAVPAPTSIASCSTGRSWSSNPTRRAGAGRAAEAVLQILAALPLGRLWAWPLRLPGLSALANAGYDAFARNRTRISTWLGLAACGVPGAPARSRRSRRSRSRRRCARGCARALPLVRELGIALMFVILAAEVSVANPSVPRALRFERRPEWMVGGGHVPAHLRELVAVLARGAAVRRDRGRRRRHARRAPRRSLQRGRQPRVVAAGRAACRCASATTLSGATTRCAFPTRASTTRR